MTYFARKLINHGTLNIEQSMDVIGGGIENFSVVQFAALQPLAVRGLANNSFFENHAQVIKNGPGTVSFSNFGSPLQLLNHGTVTINEGAFRLESGAQGEGIIHVNSAGTLRVHSNCHAGTVRNDGLLWLSPQKRLELSGQFIQGPSGRLKTTVIAGVQPILVSDDEMQLEGALELRMTPLPVAAAVAPLLQSKREIIQGHFASQSLRPQGLLEYEPTRIRWIAFVDGDADGDNIVDVDDLLLLVQNWGPCSSPPAPCTCDMNADGTVDVLDLQIITGSWQ
jgi:hypothetical protein